MLTTIYSLQVMQFGRIDGNAYTLDFQYPFSALQAFSVALGNTITLAAPFPLTNFAFLSLQLTLLKG